MDSKDFSVTVDETIEAIDRAIEALALDSVDTFPDEHSLRLEFADMSRFMLVPDRQRQLLVLQTQEELYHFYFDEAEED